MATTIDRLNPAVTLGIEALPRNDNSRKYEQLETLIRTAGLLISSQDTTSSVS
jgi:hypothetical protein